MDSLRSAAARVLDRSLSSSAPVDAFLAPVEEGLPERDRALLHALVLGTLRWLRRLDHVLAAAAGRPLERIDRPLLAPLRLGAFQLLFLDRVPAHAAVDEAVRTASGRLHGAAGGFVNAVLRRIAAAGDLAAWPVHEQDPVRRLAIETSHPDFLAARWVRRHGEARAAALMDVNNRPKAPALLAFADRGGRDDLARRLAAEGIETEPSRLSPLGLVVRRGDPLASAPFHHGDAYLQDEASQVAAWIPPPAPGERVLDALAAPGGKSLALVASDPGARVVAADRKAGRLATMRRNLVRLRRSVPLVLADAASPPFAGSFDRVLLDLPCSGTGTLRKHPELKWRVSEAELARLAAQGAALAAGSAPAVRPGGLLVLVTCSLEPEENEDVAARVVEERPEFTPVDLEPLLPRQLASGIEALGRWRLLPADEHDGFTVHVLRRSVPGAG